MDNTQLKMHLTVYLKDAERRECERDLYAFVKRAWLEIEPGTPFVENWHIKTVCHYLMSFHRGELPDKRLIINIPPGMMKSILLVCYNAWAWIDQPHLRFLSIANADDLSTRDSLRVKAIVTSDWYQGHWPLALLRDQNEKTLFVNEQRGHRESQGITACTTGKRGDCFPAYMQIDTEQGIKPIVDIKEGDLVWSYNHLTTERELKPVLHTIHKQNCEIVELVCSNGEVIHCTPDHKFWTVEEGYVAASDLNPIKVPASYHTNVLQREVEHFRYLFSREGGVFNKDFIRFRKFGFNFSWGTVFSSPRIDGLWTYTKLFSKYTARCRLIYKQNNFLLSESSYRNLPRILSSLFFSPITPELSYFDIPNCVSMYRVFFSNNCTGTSVQTDSFSHIRGELRTRPVDTYRESTMSLSISDVLRTCTPSKVINSVVGWITIKVSNLMSGARLRAMPSRAHTDVDKELYTPPVVMASCQGVPIRCNPLLKNLLGIVIKSTTIPYLSWFASKKPCVTDRVHTLISRDGTPLNVIFNRRLGHIADTYCLTIKDNHNMYVGERQGVVNHNCLLLDDLLDAKHAFSDVKRQYVNDAWDQALTSRLNDMVHSGVILIMQRLHEKDITGHLLSKTKSKWTHLCIPMRYEGSPTFDAGKDIGRPDLNDPRKKRGELLFEKRFPLKSVEQLEEDLGEFGTSGQLAQRPQPSGGGIIKTHWWRIWPDDVPLPKILHQFASFDTAFSDKSMKDAAFSAMTRWGIFWHEQRQRYCLLSLGVWWDRVGYSELRSICKEIDKKHDLDVLLIERKSTGISLIQDLKVAVPGKVRAYTPGAGEDKVARAHSVSPLFQSGLVYVPNKLWAIGDGIPGSKKPGLIGWVAQFPTGGPPCADLTDTVTQALIYLRGNHWLGDMDEDTQLEDQLEHNPSEEEMEDYSEQRTRFYG